MRFRCNAPNSSELEHPSVMADQGSFTDTGGNDQAGAERRGPGARRGGGRDQGGFRIRLSDNEMQAARQLQEAFNLRSTVAVLGFSLRTMAQLLADGQLDAVVASQPRRVPRAERGGRPVRRGEGRGEGSGDGARPNPLARPARPTAVQEEAPTPDPGEPEAMGDDSGDSTPAPQSDPEDTAADAADPALSDPHRAEAPQGSAGEPA